MKINRLKRNMRAYRYFFKRFARSRAYYLQVLFLSRKKTAVTFALLLVALFFVMGRAFLSRQPVYEMKTLADYAAALEKGSDLYEKERYEDAFAYLYPATRQNARAAFLLGMMYYNGLGVERDLKQAYENFKVAAETQDEARYMLAQMGFRGEAKGQRKGLATKMLVESAYAGVAQAQRTLGVFYMLSGEKEQAYFWLALASGQGDEKARKQKILIEKSIPEAEKSLLDLEVDGFSVRK